MLLVRTVAVINFIEVKKIDFGVLKLFEPVPFSTQQMLKREVCERR